MQKCDFLARGFNLGNLLRQTVSMERRSIISSEDSQITPASDPSSLSRSCQWCSYWLGSWWAAESHAVGTSRNCSSFSTLNFLPVFKHKAFRPWIAKSCGGTMPSGNALAMLCLWSGPWARWTFMRRRCSPSQQAQWMWISYSGMKCFLRWVESTTREARKVMTHCLADERGNCFRTEDIFPTDDRECTGTWRILLLRRIAGTENKYVCETLVTLFYFPTVFVLF